jgi:hypothetical protein
MSLLLTADSNPGTASWSDADFAAGIAVYGAVAVLNGNTQATVSSSSLSGLGGSLVLITVGATGWGEATKAWYSWSGDDLQINVNANPGQDVSFSYAVLAAL